MTTRTRPSASIRALDTLRRSGPVARVVGALLAFIVVAFVLGPQRLGLPDPAVQDLHRALLGPGTDGHLLGTDALGRDIAARVIAGGRVSLAIGAAATLVGLLIGGLLGVVAGYRGGRLDTIVTRLLDVMLAFPALIFAMTITSFVGGGLAGLVIAVAVYTVPAYARLARSLAIATRERGFVRSAVVMGGTPGYALRRHVIPHILPSMLAFALLALGTAVAIESALSFLGLGVQPPTPSWGNMIAEGQPNLSSTPLVVLAPAAMVFICIICLNLLGDELQSSDDQENRR